MMRVILSCDILIIEVNEFSFQTKIVYACLFEKGVSMKKLLIIGTAFLMLACNNQNKKNSNGADSAIAEVSTEGAIPANNPADVLPHVAKKFIEEHFPNATIQHVENKQSPVSDGTVFDVDLSDKTEIDFDKDGEWREISTKDNVVVPLAVLPASVQEYINANYAGQNIKSVDKEIDVMAVELANDTDLVFDLDGKFLRVDK